MLIEELRGALLLSQLSQEQQERVARRAVRLRLEDGQMLFSQGDPSERFYLVLSGQIRLFRLSPDGAEKVIEIAGAFQDNIDAFPIQFLRIVGGHHPHRAASQIQLIAGHLDHTGKPPVDRIVFQQMCIGFNRPGCIDRNHLNIVTR